MIILDLETDGLLPELTKIFCAVAYDTEKDSYVEFTPENVYKLPIYLNSIRELSCQNGISFDLKVLKKIYNYEYKGKYFDTVLASRILWPDLENIVYRDDVSKLQKTTRHPHSVEAWGLRFGIAKPVIEDYTKYTDNTLFRCKEDVRIQAHLYAHIRKEMAKHNCDWNAIMAMEQKTWRIMEDVADYGWAFDLERGFNLTEELRVILENIDIKLLSVLPKRIIQVTKTESGATKAFKANEEPTESAKKWSPQLKIDGDFCKVQFEDFNTGSSAQVKDYLLINGWKPKEYNYKKDRHNKPIRDQYNNLIKASPKVPKTAEDWEEVARLLDNPDIALLAERNKASHRLSQIKGLIANVRLDHRIEAQASTCQTNTARMTHKIVVNIPKADPSVYYGKQMRSLFMASPGKVLVGCDASALEARCEAHYIYPYSLEAAEELITGDIHTKNANLFQVARQMAKNGKYAILYGCSPQKLAVTLNKPVKMAMNIYNTYWEGNPALKQLKEDLEEEYKNKGYLAAIDGRPLTIRYKHAIINTLFQSCGAISVKMAMCYFTKTVKDAGLNAQILGVFHDEMQIECTPEVAEQVGKIAVNSLKLAGDHLKLNVPLDGEYKIGMNWAETH